MSCLSFWVPQAVGPLPPPVIQMPGGSEFRLRRGFACGKTLVRRIGAAGQKAGGVVLLQRSCQSKISILTVPSQKRSTCFAGASFLGSGGLWPVGLGRQL